MTDCDCCCLLQAKLFREQASAFHEKTDHSSLYYERDFVPAAERRLYCIRGFKYHLNREQLIVSSHSIPCIAMCVDCIETSLPSSRYTLHTID